MLAHSPAHSGGRNSLSCEDKDQSGSLCSFRADFSFPLWEKSRFQTAFKHNTVSSKEEMKPFKSSVLHVVPSPAAFKLTEAFCYSPRNVYLIEKVWFCGCCERILSGGEQTCLPEDSLLMMAKFTRRLCTPKALPKVPE